MSGSGLQIEIAHSDVIFSEGLYATYEQLQTSLHWHWEACKSFHSPELPEKLIWNDCHGFLLTFVVYQDSLPRFLIPSLWKCPVNFDEALCFYFSWSLQSKIIYILFYVIFVYILCWYYKALFLSTVNISSYKFGFRYARVCVWVFPFIVKASTDWRKQ